MTRQQKWHFTISLFFQMGVLFALLLTGCSPEPGVETTEIMATEVPDPTHTPAGPGTETTVVFTIANDEEGSGIAGMPPPDWLAWGAQAFTIAPDGNFWILDTPAAHPSRLLHYDSEGVLEGQVSLEGQVDGAVDVAVTDKAVWVLGIGTQPAEVVSFDLAGSLLDRYAIPSALFEYQGQLVSNLLDDLRVGAGGELLLRGSGALSVYEFLDAAGQVTAVSLDAYTAGGHRYRVEQPGRIFIDDSSIDIAPATLGGRILSVNFLGVNGGGIFYASVFEELAENGQAIGTARIVHAFDPDGNSLGVYLLPPGAVWAETDRDLALGPDGGLYVLVSQSDHSVDILRVGFTAELASLPEPPDDSAPPAEQLFPLLPSWTTPPAGASDLEIARNTLLAFFTFLHDGQYNEAAPYFGGPVDSVAMPNPESPPADPGQFWEEACFLSQCLQVATIVGEEQIAPDEFHFLITFIRDDGTLFVLGPCCGASEADMPPVWQFPYTVKVLDGQFLVMEPPVYMP